VAWRGVAWRGVNLQMFYVDVLETMQRAVADPNCPCVCEGVREGVHEGVCVGVWEGVREGVHGGVRGEGVSMRVGG